MSKVSKLSSLNELPKDLQEFYAGMTTESPEFRNLEDGEHIVSIADWLPMDSRHKNWKKEIKANLPEYVDYTPQTAFRFVATEGGSHVHRTNHLAFLHMSELTESQVASGDYTPIGDEGQEYACIKNEDGTLNRVPSEKGMEAVNNIQNQIAYALGKTGMSFHEAIDAAMVDGTEFGIRIESKMYGTRSYPKITAWFPVKAEAGIEVEADLTTIEGV